LAEGRLVRLDMDAGAQDGEDNLMVVSQDTLTPLLFDLKGLPGERLFLDLEKKNVLELELLCQTLERDGTVRPALWRQVDTLSVCGPRDCAFEWDAAQEEIVFGDGLHGAVPEPGKGAVMVASLILSECGGGNLPAGSGLVFTEDGTRVENGPASGGVDGETLQDARNRLLRKLENTVKCQSAADFAQCVLRTPGLRLAGAKALPGYDPEMGADRRHTGYVSVLVLPASEAAWPMPDSRLLAAADRQLERFRPVCVQARAIAPRYISLSVSLHALVQPGTRREALEAVLRSWLRPRADLAGEQVRRNDALALLQKTDGVLQVYRLDLRPLGTGGYLTAVGDLRLPPDGLPALQAVEIELTEV
ncbi:MAG: baseplate J/gp47 family protein, partial [Oscillibacter sp.]|nr:baseplate J/gp47 family protein [Oscillibacter sp.]